MNGTYIKIGGKNVFKLCGRQTEKFWLGFEMTCRTEYDVKNTLLNLSPKILVMLAGTAHMWRNERQRSRKAHNKWEQQV
jgi:hypothetical protein